MIKILAIGNSFSQDATCYLKDIADSLDIPIRCSCKLCSLRGYATEMCGASGSSDKGLFPYDLGLTWVEALLGADATACTFAPEDTDPALCKEIAQTVHTVCRFPF